MDYELHAALMLDFRTQSKSITGGLVSNGSVTLNVWIECYNGTITYIP